MSENIVPFPPAMLAITCRMVTPEGLGASLMLEMRRGDVPPEAAPGVRLMIEKNDVKFTVEIVSIDPCGVVG